MRLPNPFKHEPVVSIATVLAFIAWLADVLHNQQLDGAAVVNWRNAALAGAIGVIRSFVWSPASVEKALADAKAFASIKLGNDTVSEILAVLRHELGLETPEVVPATSPAAPETETATETETVAAISSAPVAAVVAPTPAQQQLIDALTQAVIASTPLDPNSDV